MALHMQYAYRPDRLLLQMKQHVFVAQKICLSNAFYNESNSVAFLLASKSV